MASERYGYRLRNVASASANRSGALIITLAEPNSAFLSLLDIPVTKSGTERQGLPVGTGPYVFEEEGGAAWLTASGDWWQGKSLPVERIELVHAKDRETAAYLFTSHQTALISADPTVSMPASAGQAEIVTVPTPSLQFIGFNTAEGRVFANPAARSAFSLGIQREMLSETFLAGRALAAQLPISPASPLYPVELDAVYSQEALLTALAAAGQNTGEIKELRMLVNGENSFRVANAQFIAEGLSTADWRITVEELPWEEYLAALEAGDFDLYYGEVRLTADWDLRELLGTGGALNYGGYSDVITVHPPAGRCAGGPHLLPLHGGAHLPRGGGGGFSQARVHLSWAGEVDDSPQRSGKLTEAAVSPGHWIRGTAVFRGGMVHRKRSR